MVEGTLLALTAVVSPVIEVNRLINIFEIGRFAKLKRLLTVTSLVIRFISNVRARGIYERPITACEIKQAEIMWVKAAQLQLQQQGNYNQLAHRNIEHIRGFGSSSSSTAKF